MNSEVSSYCKTPDPQPRLQVHQKTSWFTSDQYQKICQTAVKGLTSSPFFANKLPDCQNAIVHYAHALMDYDLDRCESKEKFLSVVEAYTLFDSEIFNKRKEMIRGYIHSMCGMLHKQLKKRESNINMVINTFQQKHGTKGISAEKKLVYEKLLHRWRSSLSLIVKKLHDWTHDDCENARKTIDDVDSCVAQSARQKSPPQVSIHQRPSFSPVPKVPQQNSTPTFRTPHAPPHHSHRNSGSLRPPINTSGGRSPNSRRSPPPPSHQRANNLEICCVCARELGVEREDGARLSPGLRRIATPIPESEESSKLALRTAKRKRDESMETHDHPKDQPIDNNTSPSKRVKHSASSNGNTEASLSDTLYLKFREAILNRDKTTIERLIPNFWHSLQAVDKLALIQLCHQLISKDTDIMGHLLSAS